MPTDTLRPHSGAISALRLALGAAIVVVAFLSTRAVVDAHSSSASYPYEYPADTTVPFFYHSSVPSGAKPRITEGSQQWTNVRTRHAFRPDVAQLDDTGRDCNTEAINARTGIVYWEGIDGSSPSGGSTVGTVSRCRSGSGSLLAFRMTFDSAEPWYMGTSTTVPAGQPDLASVAAHEMGHATGFKGHFDDAGSVPECARLAPTYMTHVMCKSIRQGVAQHRVLREHDTHTYKGAYDN